MVASQAPEEAISSVAVCTDLVRRLVEEDLKQKSVRI